MPVYMHDMILFFEIWMLHCGKQGIKTTKGILLKSLEGFLNEVAPGALRIKEIHQQNATKKSLVI